MDQWTDNDAADAAFERLFATLPAVEPSPAFIQAAVDAAWQARARHVRIQRFALTAAASLVVFVGVLFALAGPPQWLLLMSAEIATGTVMAFVWSATAVAEFWTLMLRGGSAVARVVAMPQTMALLVTAEVLGGLALYTLHRLLREDIRFRNSGPLCI